MKKTILVMIGLVLNLSSFAAVGLECSKAKSKVELLICDDKNNLDLWTLDYELNKYYGALISDSDNRPNLISAQKKWLKEVRNVCSDAGCLRKVYKPRIADLKKDATLCKVQELVVFSCSLQNAKVVSLCASEDASPKTGYMQFRMGSNQSVLDVEFPQNKTPAKTFFKFYSWQHPKAGTYAISFWDLAKRYSLFLSQGAIGYNGAGIILSQNIPPIRVSFSKCVNDAIVFDDYHRVPVVSFYYLDDRLGLEKADGDISLNGEGTDE